MKNQIKVIALSMMIAVGTQNASAQFGKLKNVAGKIKSQTGKSKTSEKSGKSKKSSKGGKAHFEAFNSETDELGVTGQYFDYNDKQSFGFRFEKEKDGNIVNHLNYFEKKGDSPQLVLTLKEKYHRKHKIKLFFVWATNYATGYVELIEIAPGVLAQVGADQSVNRRDIPVYLTATRKVKNVYAKNKEDFEVWDIETAQAKVDMVVATLKSEEVEKRKKILMGFQAYKENIGKVVFSDKLRTFVYNRNDTPSEDPKNFKKELELGNEIFFRSYLNKPMDLSYPGAWYNISYEIGGIVTDREALRKQNGFYSKNIGRKNSPSNKVFVTWVQGAINYQRNAWDYAYVDCLYKNKDKFQVGQSYELTVRIYAYKDGENVGELATGKVNLKYTEDTKELLFSNDPNSLGVMVNYERQLDD